MRWIRTLLPTALLIVSAVPLASPTDDEVITLDVDAVGDVGPLSIAAALARRP